ncbi:MAG TPA: hypothetical protein VEP50_12265 [bacterium]|nr:hypothetical protein [bacterium]
MTQRRSKSTLPWLLGVLVVAGAAALYLNMHGGAVSQTSPPLPQASQARPVLATATSSSQPSGLPQAGASSQKPGAQPGSASVPAAAPSPSTGTSPAAGAGGTGRSDPFAPLAVPRPVGPPPSSVPSVATGLGLPLPPGAGGGPGSGAPGLGAPGLSLGAGMTVTGIVGAQPRVAIIESGGQTYVVGVGETVSGAVVVSIEPQKVVLKQNGVTFELPLGGASS